MNRLLTRAVGIPVCRLSTVILLVLEKKLDISQDHAVRAELFSVGEKNIENIPVTTSYLA